MTDRPDRGLPSLQAEPWLADPRLQAVFDALTAQGGEARVAGGAVRNALLAMPVGDIDIATTEPPDRVMALADKAGLTPHPTGLGHGTVTVVAGPEDARLPVEVTTLRVDVKTYGRHAEVAFTADWAEDAARRDFTMNALYCDRAGGVHDPLGGYPDLAARRVRFVGDPVLRIREDYLRILRFFRMHAIYGRDGLDREGLDACTAERAGLDSLSAERVRAEVLRLLAAPGALAVVDATIARGILHHVVPAPHDRDTFAALLAIEAAVPEGPDPLRRLFALSPGDRAHVARLGERLRLSNAEAARLASLAAAGPVSPALRESERKSVLYHLGLQTYRDAVLLAWARSGAGPGDESWRALHALGERWQPPRFPVSGADILARGVPPGPEVGRLLAALEDWWVATGFPEDKEAVLARLDRFGVRREGGG